MDKTRIKKDLEKIIDICKDGVKGYETAAEKIENKDESLKTLFLRLAQQRKGFVGKIKIEAIRLGIELGGKNTFKGFFHRSWLTAKANFGSDEKDKVIDEAMRGERKALEVYSKIIADTKMPEYISDTLKEQQDLIKVAIKQLSDIKTE